MRILITLYLITSWGYFIMYLMGAELVVKYANGLLYAMMLSGPILTCLGLVLLLAVRCLPTEAFAEETTSSRVRNFRRR